MSDAALPTTGFRQPLDWTEIPLPPGIPRDILDPENRAQMRLDWIAHKEEIRARRAKMWARCEDDIQYREAILVQCEQDPAFWIDYFAWTYDDRVGEDEEMILYPFQLEKIVKPYVQMCKTKGRDRWTQVVNKSRGVGYTWVELFCRLHSWLFKEAWSVMIGAVTKNDVDDGGLEATHESLMGKMRYGVKHLPKWMRMRLVGPLWERDVFNHKHLLKNPMRPKNLIVGAQFSGLFARSHRFSEIWGDEIAHADAMRDADRSLKQATNRFSGGSTPLGKGTFHAQLFLNQELKAYRFTLHWSEHPELDVAWYNDQREHMTDDVIASELDCSFEGSAGNRVLGEVNPAEVFTSSTSLVVDGKPVADPNEYTEGLPLHAIIDPGIMDPQAVVWGQWDERRCEGRVVDFVQEQGRAIDWIVPFLLGEIPERTYDGRPWPYRYNIVEHSIIRRHKVWGPPAEVFGDHYGTVRSHAVDFSAYDVLREYGIDVTPIRIDDDVQALVHLRILMRYLHAPHRLREQRNGPQEFCPTLSEVLTQWRYPRRKPGDYREISQPVKDQHDHGGDCLKMWASTIPLPEAREQPLSSGRVLQGRGSDLIGGPKRWGRR